MFAAPASASVPGFNWSGFYIGANAGGSFDNNNLSFHDDSVAQDLTFHGDDNSSSFVGGGQLGFNWWWGNTLVGLDSFAFYVDRNGGAFAGSIAGLQMRRNRVIALLVEPWLLL
jgi:outer membrane immunogenic protein